jgi:hypothetical protein
MAYLAIGLIGLMYGFLVCLFFIRTDKIWVQLTVGAGGIGGLMMTFYPVFTIITGIDITEALVIYLFTFIIGAFLNILMVIESLKSQTGPYAISKLDILLGYKQLIAMYYQAKMQEISDIIDHERAKREQQLAHEQLAMAGAFVTVPTNFTLAVDNNILRQGPDFVESVAEFARQIGKCTDMFLKAYDTTSTGDDEFFEGYLYALCTYTARVLMRSKDVRVSFRYLDKHNNYVELVAFSEDCDPPDEKRIVDKSCEAMIVQSAKTMRSLVKTANQEIMPYLGKNEDSPWVDYLTLTFRKFFLGGKPLLSMEICTDSCDKYSYFLYFLSYCKIEKIIQQELEQFNSKCNIITVIKNIREGCYSGQS